MAMSKRDLLRKKAQENEAARGAETVLSPTPSKEVETPKEVSKEAESVVSTEVKVEIKPTLNLENVAKESEIIENPVVETKKEPKTEKKSSAKPKVKKYTGPDKNLGMRLVSQEDIDFLNFYPIQLGLTKKDYFNQLMEQAIADAEKKPVDLSNEMIKQFMKGGRAELTTKNVTIAVPEDMIVDMKKAGAKHRMIIQRYIAYVVYKARTEAKDFE